MIHAKREFLRINGSHMYGPRLTVYAYQTQPDGSYKVVTSITAGQSPEVTEVKDENLPTLLQLDADAAQTLMDDLYHAGVRPSHGVASAGQAQAMTDHIADLQKERDHLKALVDRLMQSGVSSGFDWGKITYESPKTTPQDQKVEIGDTKDDR